MSKIIYMDNNATTAVAPEAFAAMKPFLTDQYFNPSSMYEAARAPAHAITAARATIAACLGGVSPDEIIFTGSATESNNTAIFGAIRANRGRRHIITTAVEHPAVLEVCREAAREGCELTVIGVNRRGEIDITEFIRALRPDTLLVTVMHANNETGVIFPVAELVAWISKFCTLEAGDVISTGTPPGVGLGKKPPRYLKAGDVVELEVAGLGCQRSVCENA